MSLGQTQTHTNIKDKSNLKKPGTHQPQFGQCTKDFSVSVGYCTRSDNHYNTQNNQLTIHDTTHSFILERKPKTTCLQGSECIYKTITSMFTNYITLNTNI